MNLTHGYATPCAGHCTNQTKDGSSLNQPSPRQPKQKEVNVTGFLKWKYDFLWYGSVINKRNATCSPVTPKDTSTSLMPWRGIISQEYLFPWRISNTCPDLLAWFCPERAHAAVELVFQVCVCVQSALTKCPDSMAVQNPVVLHVCWPTRWAFMPCLTPYYHTAYMLWG